MNWGKVAAGALALAGALGGAALYWLQTRAYYEEPEQMAELVLTTGGIEAAIAVRGTSIDAISSPLRYRACFDWTPPLMAEPDVPEFASPTVAPRWFDCFDATAIGTDLERGGAASVLAQRDITYGVDRIAAFYPDGRGYAWHQINRCGRAVFDGEPLPEDCPPLPEDASF